MLPARRPWGRHQTIRGSFRIEVIPAGLQSGSTRHRRRSWRTAQPVIPNRLSASGVSLPTFGGGSAFQPGAPRQPSREGFSLRRLSYLLR
jgi:hypothetical protein